MMRNTTVDSLSPLLFCIAFVALTHELNNADCGYQVHKTEKENKSLAVYGWLETDRDEDDLENEIKIVKAIGKDINMTFLLKIVLKVDNNLAYSTIP
jgi:hypothetical protein